MNFEYIENKLLRLAKEAFDLACTIRPTQRIEVYLEDEKPMRSEVLEDKESLVYGPNRRLIYQIYGHDYLEPEITAWIDYARAEEEPKELEQSLIETGEKIAKERGVTIQDVHSNEIFANLNMDQLEHIEHAILEYWWHGDKEENGKMLAQAQIDEALTPLKA